jgi:basic membrane lipoprotein Med (substrate-binding protein (PBP1-ABC) superfamily)
LTDPDQIAGPRIVRVLRLLDANKAKAAFLAPVLVAAATAAGNWIITGAFDATEIRTAAGGILFGAAAAIAAYRTRAGRAEITAHTPAD